MKEFITEHTYLVEFVYYLSGPLMLGGVFVGLLQVYFLKKDIGSRVARESTLLSISILERKIAEIDVHEKSAFEADDSHEMPSFKGDVQGFSRDGIKCNDDWLKVMKSNDAYNFKSEICASINHLETLSQYILSGICDEEQCYNLEGSLILIYIEKLKPFIAYYRGGNDKTVFENIITLHDRWSNRMKHDDINRKKSELDITLKQIKRPLPLRTIGR